MKSRNLGKLNPIIQLFRNYRIQTQILIMNFIIISVVIPLIIATQQMNNQIMVQYLQDSQEAILFRKNYDHIENVMDSFQQQVKFFYQKTQNSLEKVNSLYQKIQSINIQFSQTIQKCSESNEDEIYPEDYFYPLFCISTYSAPQSNPLPTTDQYKLFQDFELMLNQMLLQFDPTDSYLPDNIYIALDDELETTAWWPQWARVEGYHPQQRSWYKSHKEKYSANSQLVSQISPLYEYYTIKPVMAMTATYTLNTDGKFEGVIASDIELNYNDFKHDTLNLMLIDLDGTLIITNYENQNIANSKTFYKFYDSNVTGFNQDDWDQIILYLNRQPFLSNCKLKLYPSILCRFNQITQQDVIFSIRLLDNPNYIILIFNNMTLEYQIMQHSDQLINDLNQSFFINFAIIISVIFILLILQTILIWKLFHPLYKLMMHSKLYIKANSNKLLFRQQQYYWQSLNLNQYFGSNVIFSLKQAYQSIYNRICNQTSKKNDQCQLLQKYQYPVRPSKFLTINLPELELEDSIFIDQSQVLSLIKRALVLSKQEK